MKCNHAYYFSLALLILPFTGCASLQYSAEPIEAWVVDAETKQPLEGVVITANWQLEEGTFGGNVQAGQLNVMETTTDKEGRFRFHGWGPLKVAKGHLVNRDPQLLLFKSGYEYQALSNKYSSDRELRLRPVRWSDWNGKTIELRPFEIALAARREERRENPLALDRNPFPGTVEEEYAKHLSFITTNLGFIEDDCNWKKTPQMILALQKQTKIFSATGINRGGYSISSIPTSPAREVKCGSPQEFFQRFSQ